MTFVLSIRYLRASLLALFVVAQVAGVVPLIYEHTLDVYETTPVASHHHPHVNPTATHPDADHHHGMLDLHDQCCALHTLAGPLPYFGDSVPIDFVSFRIMPDDVIALAGENPAVLDRPPRPMSLS